jgi:Tfp pilus assembly protein PilF
MYPKSYNAYDSLAEAYMTAGNNKKAIANYRKSLKLNPKNTNATDMIKKMETQSPKS